MNLAASSAFPSKNENASNIFFLSAAESAAFVMHRTLITILNIFYLFFPGAALSRPVYIDND